MNCESCWHLWTIHGATGCHGKVFPSYSLTGEPCACEHTPPQTSRPGVPLTTPQPGRDHNQHQEG